MRAPLATERRMRGGRAQRGAPVMNLSPQTRRIGEFAGEEGISVTDGGGMASLLEAVPGALRGCVGAGILDTLPMPTYASCWCGAVGFWGKAQEATGLGRVWGQRVILICKWQHCPREGAQFTSGRQKRLLWDRF
ncbi:hypothetical protein NDU88_000605 [Pleurodeles waltl]|uniref:Uncharacterized protein n=1 Tax=Pleurodeles waltl TaxID=8319 RepID=A0AAV7SWZ7_PLEWA|nr:hypothetical protein NDU88_000605 [Pleurodeles waltl]